MKFQKRIEHYSIEDRLEEQGKQYARRFWPRQNIARWYDISGVGPVSYLPQEEAGRLERLYANLMLEKLIL